MKPSQALLTLALASSASTTAAISVLVPLYIYPAAANSTTPAAWQPLYDAAKAYPKINFQVIVNPNSGPNCVGCTHPADTNWANAITTLNRFPNVYTLGYVSTAYTKRAYNLAIQDVVTYAKWSYYTPQNVSIAGIFFDEMDNSATAASLRYYKNATSYAWANVPSDITPVVLNPGNYSPAAYFAYADTIVECENAYSSYSSPGTINTFTSGYNSQAAILLHDTPTTANLTALVKPMVTAGIAQVYVSNDCCYSSSTTLNLLSKLCAAITSIH